MLTANRTDTIEAFVRSGLEVSTDWRVTLPDDLHDARRILEAVGTYNRFDPRNAFCLVDGYRECLMAVDLAREGSIALYFRFPWCERQKLTNREAVENLPYTWGAERITTDETGRLARMLMRDLREDKADDISWDPATRTVRAWWD